MGYICPYCGEGLPEDEECPCQAIGSDDPGPGRAAKREQDRRRKRLMRANGPVESFTHAEIGERDDWVCGICQDPKRLVDPRPGAARALSPSLDHIVPVSGGGTHTRGNVRITHLWCNVERNSGEPSSPEYMRAKLSRLLDGTPVPEELHRSQFPSWRWPASPRIEYMIALYIAAGQVAADPATETGRRGRETSPAGSATTPGAEGSIGWPESASADPRSRPGGDPAGELGLM
jgi:5-methylcytosine-specific restriction endonuclease McrA